MLPSRTAVDSVAETVCALISDASHFGVAERGLWQFHNIGNVLPAPFSPQQDDISVLSVATSHGTASAQLPAHIRMAPSTTVAYIYTKYRIVIALDVSPSMFALDAHTCTVPFTDALDALGTLLRGLVQPMPCAENARGRADAPSSDGASSSDGAAGSDNRIADDRDTRELWFVPEIHMSVVAQAAVSEAAAVRSPYTQQRMAGASPSRSHHHVGNRTSAAAAVGKGSDVISCGHAAPPPRVLIHGTCVTINNVESVITTVISAARALEGYYVAFAAAAAAAAVTTTARVTLTEAARLSTQQPTSSTDAAAAARVTPSAHNNASPLVVPASMKRATPSIAPLLESAVSLLKLLPNDAAASVVILSDCVAELPRRSGDYGNVIMQLLRHDISVHVLQLGSCSGVHSVLGYVPDTDSMTFVCNATSGWRCRHRDLRADAEGRRTAPSTDRAEVAEGRPASSASEDGVPVSHKGPAGVVLASSSYSGGAGTTTSSLHLPSMSFTYSRWSMLQRRFFVRASGLPQPATSTLSGGNSPSAAAASGVMQQSATAAASAAGEDGANNIAAQRNGSSTVAVSLQQQQSIPPASASSSLLGLDVSQRPLLDSSLLSGKVTQSQVEVDAVHGLPTSLAPSLTETAKSTPATAISDNNTVRLRIPTWRSSSSSSSSSNIGGGDGAVPHRGNNYGPTSLATSASPSAYRSTHNNGHRRDRDGSGAHRQQQQQPPVDTEYFYFKGNLNFNFGSKVEGPAPPNFNFDYNERGPRVMDYAFPWVGSAPAVKTAALRLATYTLRMPWRSVRMLLECRLKEGYRCILPRAKMGNEEEEEGVRMVLWWQPNVLLQYTFKSTLIKTQLSQAQLEVAPGARAQVEVRGVRVHIDVIAPDVFIVLYRRSAALEAVLAASSSTSSVATVTAGVAPVAAASATSSAASSRQHRQPQKQWQHVPPSQQHAPDATSSSSRKTTIVAVPAVTTASVPSRKTSTTVAAASGSSSATLTVAARKAAAMQAGRSSSLSTSTSAAAAAAAAAAPSSSRADTSISTTATVTRSAHQSSSSSGGGGGAVASAVTAKASDALQSSSATSKSQASSTSTSTTSTGVISSSGLGSKALLKSKLSPSGGDSLQLGRLLRDAVDYQRVTALGCFITVTKQVDGVLAALCDVPLWWPPVTSPTDDSDNNKRSSNRAPASGGGKSQSSDVAVALASESGKAQQQQPVTEVEVAEGGAVTKAASAQPQALQLQPQQHQASRALPQHYSRYHSAPIPPLLPPSMLRLYAPIAGLSLDAWHRWLDVERIELIVCADRAETTREPCAAVCESPATALTAGGHPSHFSRVVSALSAWADAQLPLAADVFMWDNHNSAESIMHSGAAGSGDGTGTPTSTSTSEVAEVLPTSPSHSTLSVLEVESPPFFKLMHAPLLRRLQQQQQQQQQFASAAGRGDGGASSKSSSVGGAYPATDGNQQRRAKQQRHLHRRSNDIRTPPPASTPAAEAANKVEAEPGAGTAAATMRSSKNKRAPSRSQQKQQRDSSSAFASAAHSDVAEGRSSASANFNLSSTSSSVLRLGLVPFVIARASVQQSSSPSFNRASPEVEDVVAHHYHPQQQQHGHHQKNMPQNVAPSSSSSHTRLIAVHVGFFACPPPVRVALLTALKAALTTTLLQPQAPNSLLQPAAAPTSSLQLQVSMPPHLPTHLQLGSGIVIPPCPVSRILLRETTDDAHLHGTASSNSGFSTFAGAPLSAAVSKGVLTHGSGAAQPLAPHQLLLHSPPPLFVEQQSQQTASGPSPRVNFNLYRPSAQSNGRGGGGGGTGVYNFNLDGGGTNGSQNAALAASLCCGGTPIRPSLLKSILWNRRWVWTVIPPAAAASAAAAEVEVEAGGTSLPTEVEVKGTTSLASVGRALFSRLISDRIRQHTQMSSSSASTPAAEAVARSATTIPSDAAIDTAVRGFSEHPTSTSVHAAMANELSTWTIVQQSESVHSEIIQCSNTHSSTLTTTENASECVVTATSTSVHATDGAVHMLSSASDGVAMPPSDSSTSTSVHPAEAGNPSLSNAGTNNDIPSISSQTNTVQQGLPVAGHLQLGSTLVLRAHFIRVLRFALPAPPGPSTLFSTSGQLQLAPAAMFSPENDGQLQLAPTRGVATGDAATSTCAPPLVPQLRVCRRNGRIVTQTCVQQQIVTVKVPLSGSKDAASSSRNYTHARAADGISVSVEFLMEPQEGNIVAVTSTSTSSAAAPQPVSDYPPPPPANDASSARGDCDSARVPPIETSVSFNSLDETFRVPNEKPVNFNSADDSVRVLSGTPINFFNLRVISSRAHYVSTCDRIHACDANAVIDVVASQGCTLSSSRGTGISSVDSVAHSAIESSPNAPRWSISVVCQDSLNHALGRRMPASQGQQLLLGGTGLHSRVAAALSAPAAFSKSHFSYACDNVAQRQAKVPATAPAAEVAKAGDPASVASIVQMLRDALQSDTPSSTSMALQCSPSQLRKALSLSAGAAFSCDAAAPPLLAPLLATRLKAGLEGAVAFAARMPVVYV